MTLTSRYKCFASATAPCILLPTIKSSTILLGVCVWVISPEPLQSSRVQRSGTNAKQKRPLAVLGERQSRLKFYNADNWVQLLRASEKHRGCTKTHTRAQTEKTHTNTSHAVKRWFLWSRECPRCNGSSQIKQLRDRGIKCVSITGQIFHLPPVITTLYGSITGKYQIRLFHLEDCCALRTALEINWAAR